MSGRANLALAASICGVKPGTIYRWVSDGYLTAHRTWDPAVQAWRNFYDITELLHWNDARNPDALLMRAGMPGRHAERMSAAAVEQRRSNRVRSSPDQCASEPLGISGGGPQS